MDSNTGSMASEATLNIYYNLEPRSLKTYRKIWIGHITIGAIREDKHTIQRTTVRIRAGYPWGGWGEGEEGGGEQMS